MNEMEVPQSLALELVVMDNAKSIILEYGREVDFPGYFGKCAKIGKWETSNR